MSHFRLLPLAENGQARVLTEEQQKEVSITPSLTHSSPLSLFQTQAQTSTASTGQLNAISGLLPVTPTITEQLNALSGALADTGQLNSLAAALPVTSTTGRIIRIPGARKKRTPTTDALPRPGRHMSRRLRHGIVLITVLFVAILTMLSLAPLNNGQSAFPIVRGITDWVHAEQSSWQLQSHLADTTTLFSSDSQAQVVATPPPMTLPKSVYISIAQQDAINAGISPDYFVRQINVESGFNPNAYSPAGAEGIAQFMPGTAAGLGINPWDPKQALNAAAHVMANYAKSYGGDYAKALAAYNGGTGTLQYAINACGASAWMNCLPGETRSYIRTIMGI